MIWDNDSLQPIHGAAAFGIHPYPYTCLTESYGREVVDKALELARGCSPEANLMPYIQIVLDAKRLGLTVTR